MNKLIDRILRIVVSGNTKLNNQAKVCYRR